MKLSHEDILLALVRLDEAALRGHLTAIGINPPEDPTAFWIGIHRVRAQMAELPKAYRMESREWLRSINVEMAPSQILIDMKKVLAD